MRTFIVFFLLWCGIFLETMFNITVLNGATSFFVLAVFGIIMAIIQDLREAVKK